MPFDPTLVMFDSHLEAAVFFGGTLVYIASVSLIAYAKAKEKEEKKDIAAFFAVFGLLSAAALVSVAYFACVY